MNNKIDFPPTCNRFVAYMDILGFKDRVFRKPHQEVLDDMELFKLPLDILRKEAKEKLRGKSKGWDIFEKSVVQPVSFSDSVILFSNDASLDSAYNIMWEATLLICHALQSSIPIKGAIAFGEQTADFPSSLYLGKPLIDAWELEQELTMYGVVLHHTAEEYLKNKHWIKQLEEDTISKYNTPFKEGASTHYLLVPYPGLDFAKKLKLSLPDLFCKVSGHERRYVDNTASFVNWFEQREKRNLKSRRPKAKGFKK